MRKRPLLLAAMTAAVAISLSGCAFGGSAPAAKSLAPTAKATGEITVWSWDVAATALKRLAKQYEAEHSGTKIDVVDIGYDNAYDKISVGLQAGTGLPDLITMETDHNQGYITQFPKGFVDLGPVMGSMKSDFDPFKWAAGNDASGHLRVAPWDSGTVALYYRTDYAQKAGVDIASAKTWEDLIALGKTIKAKTGHTLLSSDLSGGGPFTMMLQQNGEGIFNAAGEITVNSPEAVSVLTLIQTMQKDGLIKNVKGWDAEVSSAKNGDSVTTPNAVWWIGTLTSEAAEHSGKYAVAPLPLVDSSSVPTSNSGGSGLAVPTQAKNPQLAAAFLKYVLADKQNQASMMKDEGLFPAYLPALKTPYFEAPQEYFGGQKVYQTFADLTPQIKPVSFTADYSKASDIVANAVQAAVLGGKDPQAVLDSAAEQIATATGRKIAG